MDWGLRIEFGAIRWRYCTLLFYILINPVKDRPDRFHHQGQPGLCDRAGDECVISEIIIIRKFGYSKGVVKCQKEP